MNIFNKDSGNEEFREALQKCNNNEKAALIYAIQKREQELDYYK